MQPDRAQAPQRILCVVPPTGKFVREDRCQTPIKKLKTISLRPPIDLLYCAGSFEAAGCEVRFRDYAAEDCSWEAYESDLREFRPELILVSITTLSLTRDLEAARRAKQLSPEIRTAAIGAHFNTLDLEVLNNHTELDIALRGEYEPACAELGRRVDLSQILGITWRSATGEVLRNDSRTFEQNLDVFAFPARHLARNELYTRPDTGQPQASIVTNRGCPFSCTYCLANQVAGTKNRYRSVENVMAELRFCVEQLGIRSFLFRSELFTQNKRWVIELCRQIIDSGLKIDWACNSRVDTVNAELLSWMKRAGCWVMAFGVESGDQETLNRVQKRAKVEDAFKAINLCRAAGIRSSIYLLIGLPWDTRESIAAQATFAKRLDPDFLEVFYPYPFPGTEMHKLAAESGLIKEKEFSSLAYSDPVMPTKHLSIAELKELRTAVLRKFYLRPRFILRTLARVRSLSELVSYIRAGVGQLFAAPQSEAA